MSYNDFLYRKHKANCLTNDWTSRQFQFCQKGRWSVSVRYLFMIYFSIFAFLFAVHPEKIHNLIHTIHHHKQVPSFTPQSQMMVGNHALPSLIDSSYFIPLHSDKLNHSNKSAKKMKKEKQNTFLTMEYTVHRGDTLWGISTCYGVRIQNLKKENHLLTNTIYPHQILKIKLPINNRSINHTIIPKSLYNLPRNLLPIYIEAGEKYGIPWTVLAAIHKTESDYDTTGHIVSDAGAEGPMQFMPSTFKIYGVIAPGQTGEANIYNVDDAIYSTANMLSKQGFQKNPWEAIYAYNHSISYVSHVLILSHI